MNIKEYRPEIDGLRTIAVLSVIFFHAEISMGAWHPFKGGFLGVDIFFVISGYLITGILLDDLKSGQFSLVRFYERRARRILPALFLIIAACFIFAWKWMTPSQLENFSASTIATAFFSSNLFFLADESYFSESIKLKPLFHTWSLAVEEQFYIAFPLFLLVLLRARLATLVTLIVLLAGSLLLAHALSGTFPRANFYLIPTRAWELLAGAVLAKIEKDFGRVSSPVLNAIVPAGSLVCLFYSIIQFGGETPQPNILTVVPIVATISLIWFSGQNDIVTIFLSSRIMVGGGLISYSLYLWHQPLFSFARIYSVDRITQGEYLILIVIAVILAYFSWRFVEKPFRKKGTISRTAVWRGSCAGLTLAVMAGAAGVISHGFPSRVPVVYSVEEGVVNFMHCLRTDCIGAPGVRPTIAIVGDSHAGMLLYSLEKVLIQIGKSSYVRAGGDMYVDHYPPFYHLEDKYNNILRETNEILQDTSISTVILSARYTLRLENTPFDNKEGGTEILPSMYNGRTREQKKDIGSSIMLSAQNLIDLGKKIVIVYPVPEVGWHVPNTLQKIFIRHLDRDLSTSYDVYRHRNSSIMEIFDSIPDGPNVLKIRPDKIFCNTFVTDRCAVHLGSDVFYSDDNHLSVVGADLVVAEIVRMAKEKWGGLGD
jgi:peptidoglycan/LPS O-acetylase OafA/YrhL